MNEARQTKTMSAVKDRINTAMRELDGEVPYRRPQLADDASAIAVRVWGERAPIISTDDIRQLLDRRDTPPATVDSGRMLRCVLAVCGIPLIDVITDLELWPDLILGGTQNLATRVTAALKIVGYPQAAFVSARGSTVTIDLKGDR